MQINNPPHTHTQKNNRTLQNYGIISKRCKIHTMKIPGGKETENRVKDICEVLMVEFSKITERGSSVTSMHLAVLNNREK